MSHKPKKHRKPILVATFLFAIIITAIIFPSLAVTWSINEKRLTTYEDFDILPSIIHTQDGKIWVVWARKINNDFKIMYKTTSNNGITWSDETPLTTEPGINTAPSIFQASNGTFWLVWSSNRTGNYDIYYKTSSDNGSSWSNSIPLTTNPTDDMSPTITQASNGTFWLVWSSYRSQNYDIYYKTSSDNGQSWSEDNRLTTDPDLDKLPSVAQLKDGKIWVVWSSNRLGDYEIFYNTYDGFSWSPSVKRLTTDQNVDIDPFILQTIDEKIFVFWSSSAPSQTADDNIHYKYSTDYGTTWSNTAQLTTDTYDDVWPSATQTYETRIWVVWTSNRGDQPDGNWEIYYKGSLVGDVTGDGIVDIFDLARVGRAYGSFEGEPAYDPESDINNDGIIDMRDISLVSKNYGST